MTFSLAKKNTFFSKKTKKANKQSNTSAFKYLLIKLFLNPKSTKLNIVSKKQPTVGEMTNLISVNAQTVCDLLQYLNLLWASPLQITISVAMLYSYLGISAFVGISVLILCVPINIVIANKIKKSQRAKLFQQDSRIKAINEMLSSIKIIKFYAWEVNFKNIIERIREVELKLLKKIGLFTVAQSFTWSCAPIIISIVSFTSFILIDKNHVLDVNTAFVCLSLFNILSHPITLLPDTITALVNAKVAVNRIEDFLLLDEIDRGQIHTEDIPNVAVRLKNASFGYDSAAPYIKNLSVDFLRGELVDVLCEVGSGKTSLLLGMLGEMYQLNQGLVNINGSVAYVSQQAWIQNCAIRENILFGQMYDKELYGKVLEMVSLMPDLERMPAGRCCYHFLWL